MVRCEMWCDVGVCEMSVVRCGMLQFQTWCGIWRGVESVVLVCRMLHNARCGKLRGDVKRGGVEMRWCRIVVMKNVACGV